LPDQIATVRFPELVFGIAGPIGVDISSVEATLRDQLTVVGYTPRTIKVTNEMMAFSVPVDEPSVRGIYSDTMFKIKYADEVCRCYEDRAALARVAVRAITNERASLSGSPTKVPDQKTAYIIRQLKRPEEVLLLRTLYGRQFVLISAYGSGGARREFLISQLRRNLSTLISETEITSKADELIDIDQNERAQFYGQNIQETFPLGDVFVDGMSKLNMADMLTRFIQALFGRNDIAPTKVEYGMYAAKSASLRSSDLSRQVGAAIFSAQGELIAQGCNEVPRAFGGTYWDQEEPDFRDVRIGFDPNEDLKRHILRDLFERLSRAEMLSSKAKALGSASDIVDAVTRTSSGGNQPATEGALVGADIMDLTEYGRVVHAERCAIC
jgi:deoxycytidylate deaminase